MDITQAGDDRLSLGIERFLKGETVSYHGVVFYKNKEKSLQIHSYSDWEPDRATEKHANEKIAYSKSVLLELKQLSSAFSQVASQLPHEYLFCFDYGKGAFTLAKEENGSFQWIYPAK